MDVRFLDEDPDDSDDSSDHEPLPSLVNLTLSDGEPNLFIEAGYLTPAVLPSLRLLSVSGHQQPTLLAPSTAFAASLQHLSPARTTEVLPLLLATTQLRSFDHFMQHRIEIPSSSSFTAPLVAIRLHFIYSVGMEDAVLAFLDDALAAGLIDTKTVLFFPEFDKSHQIAFVAQYWCASRGGLRVEWKDGELETSWRGRIRRDDRGSENYRMFTSWVDARAVERENAASGVVEEEATAV